MPANLKPRPGTAAPVSSAVSPLVFAAVIEHYGANGVLYLSIALSSMILAAALVLKRLVRG